MLGPRPPARARATSGGSTVSRNVSKWCDSRKKLVTFVRAEIISIRSSPPAGPETSAT